MNQLRYYFIVLLLCCCAAVNILFYVLNSNALDRSNDVTTGHPPDSGRLKALKNLKTFAVKRQQIETLHIPGGNPSVIRKLNNAGPTEAKYTFQDNVDSPRIFEFTLNRVDLCGDNRTNSIVIVVISAYNNFLRRDAIRNTWGSVVRELNGTILFLVGKSLETGFQPQIVKESQLYGDIVQVDIIDKYENLTIKSISMLQWLTDYCSHSEYYMKVDDDVYLNVENVLKALKDQHESKFFLCHVFKLAPPDRNQNSKWYVSHDVYPKKLFPNYCSGTAYAFSADTIDTLYFSTLKTKLFPMEDVFITGLAAVGKHISHVHNDAIQYYKIPPTGCKYAHALSGHKVTIRQMYVIFAQLTNHEIDCETEENIVLRKAEKEI